MYFVTGFVTMLSSRVTATAATTASVSATNSSANDDQNRLRRHSPHPICLVFTTSRFVLSSAIVRKLRMRRLAMPGGHRTLREGNSLGGR